MRRYLRNRICLSLFFCCGLHFQTCLSQNAGKGLFKQLMKKPRITVKSKIDANNGKNPFWLVSNRYGESGIKGDNAMFGVDISNNATGKNHRWHLNYGLDLRYARNYYKKNSFYLQQAFVGIEYKDFLLLIGSKNRLMPMKNQELSTGSQTFGINARPIPEVSIEIPKYIPIWKKWNWLAVKGRFGYGMTTDENFQKTHILPHTQYNTNALTHAQAFYVRLGNPLHNFYVEGGLEMASQFGATVYNRNDARFPTVRMGRKLRNFIDAIYGGGRDVTDREYSNAGGNTLGSWLAALHYDTKNVNVKIYYDHYFEDHSMLFAQYGWLDGLIGAELNFKRNKFLNHFVYEWVKTTYQSGPIYHDHTPQISYQISGADDYYNHVLFQGWEHWGQAIGNPLFISPLYYNNGSLKFIANRFLAHHFGISGDPAKNLHYRLLFTHTTNYGTYGLPFLQPKMSNSFLLNFKFTPSRLFNINTRGWQADVAFAYDHGKLIGNNIGFELGLSKILTK